MAEAIGTMKIRRTTLVVAIVALAVVVTIYTFAELRDQRIVDRAYAQCRGAGMTETSIDVMYGAITAADGNRGELIAKFSQVYIGEPPDPAYLACITALVDAALEHGG